MYRALVSFSGLVSMTMGEVKEIKNKKIAKDLLRARYIEEVKTETKKTVKEPAPMPKIEAQADEKPEVKEEVKETKRKTTRRRKTPKKEG